MIGSLALAVLSVSLLVLNSPVEIPITEHIQSTIHWGGGCIKIDSVDPERQTDWECRENMLTNLGANMTTDLQMGTTNGNISVIYIGSLSGSSQAVTDKNMTGTLTGNGLTPAYGTIAYVGQANYSTEYKFIYTGSSQTINVTGLGNDTTTANNCLFAQFNYTTRTIDNGDNVTVILYNANKE